MKKVLATAAAMVATSSSAVFAACGGIGEPVCPTPVPEISALEGTAAIAALAAVVLLTWERSRRRA